MHVCSQAQVNHQKNKEARANFKPTNLDLNEAQRIFPMPKLTTHSAAPPLARSVASYKVEPTL